MGNAILIAGCSIDLGKIDKSRIKIGKNGSKYYDFTVIINDALDQYNQNVQVIGPQTKEEKAAKEKRVFLGNGKVVWTKEQPKKETTQEPAQQNEPDDLPF